MNDRKLFQQQVNLLFTPALKQGGFRQSGTSFRRVLGDVIHVLTIQGSRYGGQCCVCLGIHLAFFPNIATNAECDPQAISEPECEFRSRLAPEGQSDHWGKYGSSVEGNADSVASMLGIYRDRAAPYFERFSTFPSDFTRVTPNTPEGQCRKLMPEFPTKVRRDLALARIYHRLGDFDSAHRFASRGLTGVGPAVALKSAFRALLLPS